MGEVYRARDTRLGRDVAVKVLRRSSRGPGAWAASSGRPWPWPLCRHPNILAIYDIGSEGGVTYAVMELLEGETLRERLSRRCPARFQSDGHRLADRRGARGGAREGHRPPGPEARERVPHQGGPRQDPGLRPGEAEDPRAARKANPSPRCRRPRRTPPRARSWAPWATWPPSRPAGCPPTRARTSSPSGSSSTRCSRASGPSQGTRPRTPSRRSSRRTPIPCPRSRPRPRPHRAALPGEASRGPVLSPPTIWSSPWRPFPARHPGCGCERNPRRVVQASTGRWLGLQLVLFARRFRWRFLGTHGRRGPLPAGTATTAVVPSLVALPCKVLGSPESAYLTDAVPSTISTLLGEVQGMDTKVPPTSFEVEKVQGDLDKIADGLRGSDLVLSSVTAEGDHLVLQRPARGCQDPEDPVEPPVRGAAGSYTAMAREAAQGICKAVLPEAPPRYGPPALSSNSESRTGLPTGEIYANRQYSNHDSRADFDRSSKPSGALLRLNPKDAETTACIAISMAAQH